MKKRSIGVMITAAIVSLFVLASFSTACEPDWVECKYWAIDMETPLIAGQHYDAGYVHVWNSDEDTLCVEFFTENGWFATETHVVVTLAYDDIPMNKKKNSPKVGHFPEGEEYDTPVTTDMWCFDLNELTKGDFIPGVHTIYVAFHAVVEKYDGCGNVIGAETAWGKGDEFGKSWAMYLEMKTKEFPCFMTGDNTAQMSITHTYDPDDDDPYWTVVLDSNDLDIKNLPHLADPDSFIAWCVETGKQIGAGNYQVNFYSSYLSELPKDWDQYEWDQINWILNYKNANPGEYTSRDIQQAIWYLTEQTFPSNEPAMTDGAWELVELAQENGDGFYPSTGEVFGVILVVNSNKQMIMIEVDP